MLGGASFSLVNLERPTGPCSSRGEIGRLVLNLRVFQTCAMEARQEAIPELVGVGVGVEVEVVVELVEEVVVVQGGHEDGW